MQDAVREVTLKTPFPYFGGKSRVAPLIWSRLGNVRNFVEPFFGSGAVLLGRPAPFDGTETVNDADGMVSNFWRAVQADPDAVAFHADWPVNENDLHARHVWLVEKKDSLQTRLDGDPDFYDSKIAGRWCWGLCCWIGSGFCSGSGPWHSVADPTGVRKLVHLGNAGQGVNRKRVHLGDAGRGAQDEATRDKASTASESPDGDGISRKRPLVTNDSVGIAGRSEGVYEWMRALSDRLRLVRVCSGDWSRVCGPTVTVKQGLTAVFLDPPYADTADRQADLYRVDSESVAHDVREWAIANGNDKRMRICLAGYEGEHDMPKSWEVVEWKAPGGFASQWDGETHGKVNSRKERLWFSPHCLKGKRKEKQLFDELEPEATAP